MAEHRTMFSNRPGQYILTDKTGYVHVHHVTLVRILHLILVKVSFYSYNNRNMGTYDKAHKVDVTGQQRMLTLSWNLILHVPLIFVAVRVCSASILYFFSLDLSYMYINMIKSSFLQSYKGRNCIHLFVYTSELFRDQRKPSLYK